MKKLNTLCVTVALFIAIIFCNYNLFAQTTFCIHRANTTNPANFNQHEISGCFNQDYLHITINVVALPHNDTVRFNFVNGAHIVDTTFSHSAFTYDSTSNQLAFIHTSSGSYTGTISFDIEFSGCGGWFNPFGFSSTDLTIGLHGSSITFPSVDLSCSDSVGTYNHSNGHITYTVREPKVEFVPITTYAFDTSLHITSEINSQYLRYDTASRYYMVKAITGATDFFTLQVHAEHDINISSIEAVNPNTGAVISGNLIGGADIIFADADSTIIFNHTILHNLDSLGAFIHNGFLLPNTNTDSSDFILLREHFQVMQVADTSAGGCNFNYYDHALNNSWYTVRIYCDEIVDGSPCSETSPPDSLNVVCRQLSTTLGVALFLSNNLSICGDTSADYSIFYKNNINANAQSIYAAGSGTLEISSIYIPFNFLYFTFDSISIANTTVAEPDLVFDTIDHFIIIPGDSIPNPNALNSLTYQLNNFYPPNATINSAYKFLAEDDSFRVIVHGLRFNCQPPHGLLDSIASPLNQLFSLNVDENGSLFKYPMCKMDSPHSVTPGQSVYNTQFDITNLFNGVCSDSSNETDISSTIHPDLYFSYTPLNSTNPWSLSGALPNIFGCDSIQYYTSIVMPLDFHFMHDSVFITNNTNGHSAGIDIADIALVETDSNATNNTYIIHYGFLDSLNTDSVTLNFHAVLACTGLDTSFVNTIVTEFYAVCAFCPTCPRLLGRDGISLFKHCPGLCDAFVSIDTISFNRSTFGWTSDSAYLANPVVSDIDSAMADSLNLSRDRVYECDHISAFAHGMLNPSGGGYPSDFGAFSFEIGYIPPAGTSNAALNNLFHFNAGNFHFHCTNCGSTSVYYNPFDIPVDTAVTLIESITGLGTGLVVKVTIDTNATFGAGINFYDSLAYPHNYIFEVTFTGDYTVEDNALTALSPAAFNIAQIRAQFTDTGSTGTLNYCCDPYGDHLNFFKLKTAFEYDRILSSASNPLVTLHPGITLGWPAISHCLTRYFFLADVLGPVGDNFPGEFRPWFSWPDTLRINLESPNNYGAPYSFESGIFMADTGSFEYTNIPATHVTQIGNLLTISNLNGLSPLKDKKEYNQQGLMLTFRKSCTYIPHDSSFFIADTMLFEKSYACKQPFIDVIPDTLNGGNSAAYYNDLNEDNVQLNMNGYLNDSADFFLTSQTDSVYMDFHHAVGTGNMIENAWVYFTTDNPGAHISISNSTFNATGPVNGLYKIDTLYSSGNFYLKISLDSCITDSFGVTAHYGYTCNNSNFADLQTVIDTVTSQPTPNLAHWNICSPDSNYTVIIHALAPNYVIDAIPDTATINGCLSLVDTIYATNTSHFVEGDSVSLYVVPPTGFVYDPLSSYVIVDSLNNIIDSLSLGFPTGYQWVSVDTFNALASYWNIDSVGVTTPFLYGVNLTFVLVFHPDPCPMSYSSTLELASVLIGYTPCLAQSYSAPKFPNLGVLSSADYCCVDHDSLQISIAYHFNNCADSCSGVVIANVTGGDSTYYYNWSTGAITDTVTGLCAGTYYLTVHDGTGQIAFDTVTLIFTAGAITDTLIDGNNIHSLCDTSTIHLSVPTGYSYHWYKNGTLIVGAHYPNYNATLEGSYTCKIFNVCDTIITNPYLIAACCDGVIPDTVFAADNLAPPIVINQSDQIIQIISLGFGSVLHLTGGSTITGCEVIIEHNVKIELEPGASVRISNTDSNITYIHGCGYLWDGMYAPHSDNVITCSGDSTMGDVLIEDGKKAFVSDSGATITTHLTTFNRNVTGIRVENQILSGANPLSVTATKFRCTSSPLLANYTTGTSQTRSSAGIKIVDVWDGGGGVTVGDMTLGQNIFENQDTGISSIRANLIATNNIFQYDSLSNGGIGIYFSGKNTDTMNFVLNLGETSDPVATYGLPYYNEFHYCSTCVKYKDHSNTISQHPYFFIYYNLFDEMYNGVTFENTDDAKGEINFNDFSNFYYNGIVMDTFNNGSNIWVEYNNMQNPANTGWTITNNGMTLRQGLASSGSYVQIDNNIITNALNGIHLLNFPQGTSMINDNPNITVGVDTALHYSHGIWAENCPDVQIISNNVFGNWNNSVRMKGIMVNSCANFYIEGDSIDKCGQAILGVGSAEPNANILCNRIHNCHKGGIVFDGFFPTDTIHIATTSCDPLDPSDNRWYVGGAYHRLESINFTDGNLIKWYFRTAPGATFNISIAQNSGTFPILLFPNTSPPTSCCGMRTDIRSDSCTETPELCRRERLSKTINDTTEQESIVTDSVINALIKFYSKQYAYEKLAKDSTWRNLGTDDDFVYQLFFDTSNETNVGLIGRVRDALSKNDNAIAAALNELIQENSSAEQNMKTVNSIQIQMKQEGRDTFTIDEYNILWNIANTNVVLGGQAVSYARAMLNIDVEPEPWVFPMRMENNFENNFFAKLSPNPADEKIELNYSISNSNYVLIINDVFGRELKRINLISGSKSLEINCTNFNDGIYFYSIQLNAKKVKEDKFIVIHH